MSLIGGLTFALEKEGYEVTVARTSKEDLALWNGIDRGGFSAHCPVLWSGGVCSGEVAWRHGDHGDSQ